MAAPKFTRVLGFCSAALLAVSTYSHAQLSGFFAAPQTLTFASVRTMGMGNVNSVVVDPYSRNPAHVAWLSQPEGNALYARVGFDSGLGADYQMYRYEFPIKSSRRKQGLQLVYFHLRSNQGNITLPTIPPPLQALLKPQANIRDEGFYLGYGFFINKRTALGVATAFRDSETRVSTTLGVMDSKSKSKVTPKLRVSFQRQLNDQWDVGGIVTASDQRGTLTGPALLVGPGTQEDFAELDYDVGVGYHPNKNVIVATEWTKRKLSSPSFFHRDFGIHVGAEVKANEKWDLRVGLNVGGPTLGASYHGHGWRAEYAFVNGFASQDLDTVFGHSTLHTINVMKEF